MKRLLMFLLLVLTHLPVSAQEEARFTLIINVVENEQSSTLMLVDTLHQMGPLAGERFYADSPEELANLFDEHDVSATGIKLAQAVNLEIEAEGNNWIVYAGYDEEAVEVTLSSVNNLLSQSEELLGRYGGKLIWVINSNVYLIFDLEAEWIGLEPSDGIIQIFNDGTQECMQVPFPKAGVSTMIEDEILTCFNTLEDDPSLLLILFGPDLSGHLTIYSEVTDEEVWLWFGDHPNRTLSADILEFIPEGYDDQSAFERFQQIGKEVIVPWMDLYSDLHWIIIFPEGPNGEYYRLDFWGEDFPVIIPGQQA